MAYTTINDPSEYFNTVLYTGTSENGNAVIGNGFQPDWVWVKSRGDGAHDHHAWDSSRGTGGKDIYPNENFGEGSDADRFSAFGSDGFTVGGSGHVNTHPDSYVAWNWKANGGTTTAGAGNDTIATSTHQASTTSGFSIVTYTGEEANKTVKHGLSTALDMLLVKNRNSTKDWRMWFKGFSGTQRLELNNNEARATTSTSWNGTVPGSSVFSLGDDTNTNTDGDTFVAYCFHSVQGYSKFGSYKGNNNADGAFVYTGFKPALLILKNIDDAVDWYIFDNKRDTDNAVQNIIHPNKSDAASDSTVCDFLSNGFKFRTADNAWNGNGDNYIYMTFAESPFVTSNETPNNAR
tara:strand:- start:96 stop:1142 length:1047 start_codon:yes stop_codon:yes gene_type:complete